jgi:excisionase family DNA binding protein
MDKSRTTLPVLLTVDDAADLLRTTRRAVYAMVERRQLPGVVRLRRRVLFAPTICQTGSTRSARHR